MLHARCISMIVLLLTSKISTILQLLSIHCRFRKELRVFNHKLLIVMHHIVISVLHIISLSTSYTSHSVHCAIHLWHSPKRQLLLLLLLLIHLILLLYENVLVLILLLILVIRHIILHISITLMMSRCLKLCLNQLLFLYHLLLLNRNSMGV